MDEKLYVGNKLMENRLLSSLIEGEKQISKIRLIISAFLVVMIIFAAMGFARNDAIVIISELIAAILALFASIGILVYFSKDRPYPSYLGFVITTLDMILVSLPFFALSVGYPIIASVTPLPWLYVFFTILTARRFSFKISLYAGILGAVLYFAIILPVILPLFQTELVYPDGTAQYDTWGRILLKGEDGKDYYVGVSILEPIIKGVVIFFSGLIAGNIARNMRHKIEDSIDLAREQESLRERLRDSIARTADSATKTSELISSSFHEISSSTNEMITTLRNIGNNSTDQVMAVKLSLDNIKRMLDSFESIDKSVSDQLTQIQNVSIKSNKLTEGIKNISDLSSTAKEAFTGLVKLTMEGKKAIEQNLKSIEKISNSSKDILELNKEINDISENTNVLSINASIEAANAGKAGAGFTIVANQIRDLAKQTSEATRSINLAVDEITNRIDEGVRSSQRVEKIFSEITENAMSSDEKIAEISKNTEDQYQSKKLIDDYMDQLLTKMYDIVEKVNNEKKNSTSVMDEGERIQNLAESTSKAIEEEIKAGEDILDSTEEIAKIIEENKELATEMKNQLDEDWNEEQQDEPGEIPEDKRLG
jgi:methyl-accepting chemotaxis protein